MSFKVLNQLTNSDPESIKAGFNSLQEVYGEMDSLSLPSRIPEAIRSYFDCARLLWVFGWFSYPFFGWGGLHAAIAVEMALRLCLEKARIKLRPHAGLGPLLRKAVEKKLIHNNVLRQFEFLREFVELHDWSLEFDQKLHELVDLARNEGIELNSEKGSSEIRLFADRIAHKFPNVRNIKAHGLHTDMNTPSITKYHLQLARALIISLFTNDGLCAQSGS